MEYLYNGFTLHICEGGFPVSTDSMALAHFARLPKNARGLDLGSGCGTLGLLLCAKDPACTVTGIEISPAAHETALKNAEDNQLSCRLTSICQDLSALPSFLSPGSFDVCVSNPPYFNGGPESKAHGVARREDLCPLPELFRAAAHALRFGGDLFLVHRPERLAQLCACASRMGLEPKRLLLLRHKQDGPVSLVLLSCRKGAKPGLIWEEESLRDPIGNATPFYNAIYHI